MASFISVCSLHVDGEVSSGHITLDARRPSREAVSFFTSPSAEVKKREGEPKGAGGSAWHGLARKVLWWGVSLSG